MNRNTSLMLFWLAGIFYLTLNALAESGKGFTLAAQFSEVDCTSAYNSLPSGISPTANSAPEIKQAFIRYDEACFRTWDDLKDNSRSYLKAVVGAVFDSSGKPFCTATRVKSNVIMTASHCGMNGAVFRLFGYPAVGLKVESAIVASDPPRDDFEDFALWKIEDNDLPFKALAIARDFPPHQKITIVAVSQVPFNLERDESWLSSVRWSPVRAAQIWPSSEVRPPLPDEPRFSECIFHKMPTFPGMSGAPIIGISRVNAAGDPPELFIVGIHLRDGATPSRTKSCGVYGEFNVGIKVPVSVLRSLE
ncbi:hypothetical protein HFO94_30690 [Rhizobium leguminosarum]|uniref:trypsin-like serine peptidase n=1 Tax=Rhizobium leguminosarum TaxID=384 RepID=UPI001C98592A|nr:serine protease [Rhizobium leguminosarum]MBY5357825.1 hypothetical protein [Rhizobium leguminosarum]